MKALRSLLVLGLAALLLVPAAASALANQLTVQGTLLAEDGTPLSGTYELKFGLYNAGTAGKQLWTETHTDVVVTEGLFDVVLGEDPINPLLLTLFVDNAQVFLGVKVQAGPGVPAGGDPELPRRPLTKVGAAFVADHALTAGEASKLAGQSVLDLTASILAAVAAEGYVKKGTKLDQSNMPANGLNEVSNELITNQFVDTTETPNKPFPIKDNNPTGVSDQLTFPDIGFAEKLTVSVNITNSDLSTVEVKLFDPNNVEYLLLKKGTSSGTQYATSFPEPTTPVTGDLKTWVGKNPKGVWRLQVFDTGYLNNKDDGQINSWAVSIQTLSTKKVQVNGALIVSGDFTVSGSSVKLDKQGLLLGTGANELLTASHVAKLTGGGWGMTAGTIYHRTCTWTWFGTGSGNDSITNSTCTPPGCGSGHQDLGVSHKVGSGYYDYDPWWNYRRASAGTSERICLIPPSIRATIYAPTCVWANNYYNMNDTSGLLESCTPPTCASGHTDLGTNNYVTQYVGHTQYAQYHDINAMLGYTERVCLITVP